jgi:hypothetical protein
MLTLGALAGEDVGPEIVSGVTFDVVGAILGLRS